ncbi:MAG: PrsW family glutamic-type intramembrane protease, partial [Bacteroidota bacterium]
TAMSFLLILMAIAPGLLICYVIYHIDKFDKESHWQLILCFILGMVITFPAMKLEEFGESFGLEESGELGPLILLSYGVVGFSEEFVKFLVLMIYAYTRKEFNEALDGIVYAVMIGMGFATLENIIYANRFGMETTLVRAITAVPAHAVFAVTMGYYVGLAKFDKTRRFRLIAVGLLLAIFIHGTYDFFILQQYYDWLMVFATLTLCISAYFAIRLIRLHQQNSPFKDNPFTYSNHKQEIEDAQVVDNDDLDTNFLQDDSEEENEV